MSASPIPRRQAIGRQSSAIDTQCGELSREIDEQSQQLASVQQKLDLLVSEESASHGAEIGMADAVRSEEIEIALLREKERRSKS